MIMKSEKFFFFFKREPFFQKASYLPRIGNGRGGGGSAVVVHTCNPSYSGGMDQKDHSSKPVNSSPNPILKNSSQKRAGGVAQAVRVPA
jgi:hypothetical protein